MANRTNEYNKLTVNYNTKCDELNASKKMFQQKHIEFENLKQENNNMKNKMLELKNIKEQLISMKEAYDTLANKSNETVRLLTVRNKEFEHLNNQHNKLQNKNNELIQNKEKEASILNETRNNINKELQTYKNENKQQSDEMKIFKNEISSANNKQKITNKMIDDLKEELAHLKIKVDKTKASKITDDKVVKVTSDEKCTNCFDLTSKLDKLKNQKCKNCKILNDKFLNLTKLHSKCKVEIDNSIEIMKVGKNNKNITEIKLEKSSIKNKKPAKEKQVVRQLATNNYLNISINDTIKQKNNVSKK